MYVSEADKTIHVLPTYMEKLDMCLLGGVGGPVVRAQRDFNAGGERQRKFPPVWGETVYVVTPDVRIVRRVGSLGYGCTIVGSLEMGNFRWFHFNVFHVTIAQVIISL